VITGGAAGIGASYARAFAARGAGVVIADLARRQGQALASRLRRDGARALFVVTDVTDEESVRRLARAARDEFGRVDVLVNNAAVYKALGAKASIEEIGTDDWDRVMAVNVRGAWQCAKAVFPLMRRQRRGRIINITSSAALSGIAGFVHYVTSKAAVIGLTRALARELGPYGITVNAVAPGLVDNAASRALNDPDYLDRAAALRSVPRAMRPPDLIGAVLFLAGAESEFMTGQVLVVDGGLVMH
jgi:NAD(P)-dependent dehydrogenase (short-subunit alcohol dehydrogenase family)